MKIEIDIPDRAKGKHLTIFAGMEMVACKHAAKEYWEIIEEGCSRCGKCCEDNDESWPFYDPEKGCKYLGKKHGDVRECDLKGSRPFACGVATPDGKDILPDEGRKGSSEQLKEFNEETRCTLGIFRPQSCSSSAGEVPDYCSIKKRKVIKAQR